MKHQPKVRGMIPYCIRMICILVFLGLAWDSLALTSVGAQEIVVAENPQILCRFPRVGASGEADWDCGDLRYCLPIRYYQGRAAEIGGLGNLFQVLQGGINRPHKGAGEGEEQ